MENFDRGENHEALTKRFPNVGKSWGEDEDERLLQMAASYNTIEQMCNTLGRTPNGIITRLKQIIHDREAFRDLQTRAAAILSGGRVG